jgi:hypothetical protein
MIDLACLLFDHENNVSKFGVTDPNFSKNGREFLKIYVKKIFLNVRTLIENILKSEREKKSDHSAEGLLVTEGPTALFKILYTTLSQIKDKKSKPLLENMLYLFKECITIYLIGLDCVVTDQTLVVSSEFLIAIANNCIRFDSHLSKLIEDVTSQGILSENEIQEVFYTKLDYW